MDVNVGVATTILVIALSLVPPGIILALWRDSPPPTIGEILYAEHETGRPLVISDRGHDGR
jgi:hypothetical protein